MDDVPRPSGETDLQTKLAEAEATIRRLTHERDAQSARAEAAMRSEATQRERRTRAEEVLEAAQAALRAGVQQMQKADVPPTIATDEHFREIYCQGYKHALSDILKRLPGPDPAAKETEQ